jgi:hypothetical protein
MPIGLSASWVANAQLVVPSGILESPRTPPLNPGMAPVVGVIPRPYVDPLPPAKPARTNSDSDTTKRDRRYSAEIPPPDKPLAATAYANHESLLRGLHDVNPSDVRPLSGDVISVRTKMRKKEVQTLIESVNGNHRLYQNAEKLTVRLQEIGVLRAGDRVVGYAAGKVYVVVGDAR